MYTITVWHGTRVYRLVCRTWEIAHGCADAFAGMGWSTAIAGAR